MYIDSIALYTDIMMNDTKTQYEQMNDDQLLEHLVNRYGEYLLQDELRLRNFMYEVLVDKFDTFTREDLIIELDSIPE